MRVLVTGGAGFIGSAACRRLIADGISVVNADKLTYAANPKSLAVIAHHPRYAFERADICDRAAMDRIFGQYQPDAVLHLAAESHVDRSITDAAAFIHTNVVGTYQLLEAARQYWQALSPGPSRRVPVRSCLDRRSLRLAGPGGPFSRGYPISAELALFGQQGGIRPSGKRLVQDLWTARDRLQ